MMNWFCCVLFLFLFFQQCRCHIEAPESCIRSREACNATRSCQNSVFLGKDCLHAQVPPYIASYSQIACCFKCCVEFFVNHYHLKSPYPSLLNRTFISWGFPQLIQNFSSGVIFGFKHHSLTISEHVVTNQSTIGVPSVVHIMTSLYNSTVEAYEIDKLGGRRAILSTPMDHCLPIHPVLDLLSSPAPFNNPRISVWLTSQFPCGWNSPPFIRDPLGWIGSQMALTITSLKAMNTSSKYKSWNYKFENVRKKIRFVPLGARDPLLLEAVTKELPESIHPKYRSILFDCSCVLDSLDSRTVPWSESQWKNTIRPLCFSNLTSMFPDGDTKLFTDYKKLFHTKFVLSSTSIYHQSACEWEAVIAGAIPIIDSSIIHDPYMEQWYTTLPHLSLSDWSLLSSQYLNQQLEQLFPFSNTNPHPSHSLTSKWSISSALVPKFLALVSETMISGKPPTRFFRDIRGALKRNIPNCRTVAERASTVNHFEESVMNAMEVQEGIPGEVLTTSSSSSSFTSSMLVKKRNQTYYGDEMIGNYRQLLSSSGVGSANNPDNNGPTDNHNNMNNNNNNNNINSNNINSIDQIKTPFIARKRDRYDPNWKAKKKMINNREKKGSKGELEKIEGRLSPFAPNNQSQLTSWNHSMDPFTIDLVIPRCCEDGIEFSWLTSLLAVTKNTRAFIYYKCSSCLPKSYSEAWIEEYSLMQHPNLTARHPKGILLLDDQSLLDYGSRVQQIANFDLYYNGKEVTAYLQHIITHYYSGDSSSMINSSWNNPSLSAISSSPTSMTSSLANQTIFLHTVPNAHIFFTLFYRLMNVGELCHVPVSFLHLNSRYKEGAWGRCCGRQETCKLSTWKYLFGPGKYYNVEVSTYSSAQFTASREAILRRPLSFWIKMMKAINGSVELEGCPTNSEPGKVFGGHQLTGQYERMWHVIFGHNRIEDPRNSDSSLPKFLRIDCKNNFCLGAV